jgi:hypothetical protein
MPFFNPSLSRSQLISWRRALWDALCLDLVLLSAVTWSAFSSTGADSPLAFTVASVAQFPASLLFKPLITVVKAYGVSDRRAMTITAAAVVLLEFPILVILCKRPWRSKLRASPSSQRLGRP